MAEGESKNKPKEISIKDYINSSPLSDRDKFVISRMFHSNDKLKTMEDWEKEVKKVL